MVDKGGTDRETTDGQTQVKGQAAEGKEEVGGLSIVTGSLYVSSQKPQT